MIGLLIWFANNEPHTDKGSSERGQNFLPTIASSLNGIPRSEINSKNNSSSSWWKFDWISYQSDDIPTCVHQDIKTAREVMINDSYLHRLLMIEIISTNYRYPSLNKMDTVSSVLEKDLSSDSSSDVIENSPTSELVTFNKMWYGMKQLGKSLTQSFGGTISRQIVTLMHRRNEIIRDYYISMRNIVCQDGVYIPINKIEPSNEIIRLETKQISELPLPKSDIDHSEITNDHVELETRLDQKSLSTDISIKESFAQQLYADTELSHILEGNVNVTIRKLEIVTRELIDTITSAFHVLDDDKAGYGNKRPMSHYQKLFNLIKMYDKELINQAKAYASKQYNISMNYAHSSLEIVHHINDELNNLIMKSHQNLQTIQ